MYDWEKPSWGNYLTDDENRMYDAIYYKWLGQKDLAYKAVFELADSIVGDPDGEKV